MYIHRLAHALGDAGHHVDIVHCVDSYHLLHPKDPEIEFPDHPNVSVHSLRSGAGWLSPLLTQQTGRPYLKRDQIRTVLESKPFDVIHYHNISLLGPTILTLEPPQGQFVKLYTTHEHWLICPTHVLWKFNSRLCEKPECLRCTTMAKRPPQLWRYTDLLDKSSQHVDQFMAPSRFTANIHVERGFARSVAQLPYFINRVDHEWQNPAPRPQKNPYFLFVGRLELIKGVQTLIQAWEKTREVELLIVGTGTHEHQLRAQAASNPRIRFLGALPQEKLGALYYHALACIVPSIVYETFGIIIIESFARKTPVISRDLGALSEVIQDSGGGFLYRTEEELLAAIHRTSAFPELRSELGEKGYRAFERSWSREAHLKLYFNLLQEAAVKKFGFIPFEQRVAGSSPA